MSYGPLSFGKTTINEDSKRIEQPARIKTPLKPHQLAMINEMNKLETPVIRKAKLLPGALALVNMSAAIGLEPSEQTSIKVATNTVIPKPKIEGPKYSWK